MGQGRGSAMKPIMDLGLTIMCLLAIAQPILGASYSVGGSSGWTYNVVNWPRGKSFRAGDTLAFNYARNLHNVVPVGVAGYNRCSGAGARPSQTGRDSFRLKKGANYFICSVPGHCQAGMKIAVTAY